jgi:hypothetical protein
VQRGRHLWVGHVVNRIVGLDELQGKYRERNIGQGAGERDGSEGDGGKQGQINACMCVLAGMHSRAAKEACRCRAVQAPSSHAHK